MASTNDEILLLYFTISVTKNYMKKQGTMRHISKKIEPKSVFEFLSYYEIAFPAWQHSANPFFFWGIPTIKFKTIDFLTDDLTDDANMPCNDLKTIS